MSINGMQTEAQKVIAAIHLDEVKENLGNAAQLAGKSVSKELSRAGRAMSKVASQVEKSAKANPLATAGVLLGAGALLGALLHSVLRPAPSAGDLIFDALKRGASQTGDSLRSGYKSARRVVA